MIATTGRAVEISRNVVKELPERAATDKESLAHCIAGIALSVENRTAIEIADTCDLHGHHQAADLIRERYGIDK